MAGRTKLRIEILEDRSLLSAAPVLDLNGVAGGTAFAVERVNGAGLVALVSHDMFVGDGGAEQFVSAKVTIANPREGDILGALTYGTNISAVYAYGVLQLTGLDTVDNYQQVLRTTRFNSTVERNTGDQIDVSFAVNNGQGIGNPAHSIVTVVPAGTASVVGRHLFYNNSKFDGGNPAADAADDLAIATDKQPLSHGQKAALATYTSYHRGINGIMVDIAGPHGAVSVNDFIFQVGNNDQPDTWSDAPAPDFITTRPGAGQAGSDRVELIWADGAIANQWLQVVVAANSHTGLTKPNTFLFGNYAGESGNSASDARVTAIDALRVINSLSPGTPGAAAIDNVLDYGHDGKIAANDALVAINQIISHVPELKLINITPIAPDRLNSSISTGSISTMYNSFPIVTYQPPLFDGRALPSYTASVGLEPATVTLRYLFYSYYNLSMEGGTTGPHSATNPLNYQLFKGGVEQPGSIVSAAVNTTSISPGAANSRTQVTLTFNRPLSPGDYRIVASGRIDYVNSQPIFIWFGDTVTPPPPVDSPVNSTPGSEHSDLFTVSPIVRQGDASIVAQYEDAPQGNVLTPAVASTPSGDFIVAWSKQDFDNHKSSLFIQRFSPTHVPLGSPQLVSTDLNPRDVTLGIDATGTLTIVWSSQSNNQADPYPVHIFARRFGADLQPLGDEFNVDSNLPASKSRTADPNVAVSSRGNVVVVWSDDRNDRVVAQLYDATGQPHGGIVQLSSESDARRSNSPRVAMDAQGNFAAVWTERDFGANRVVARLFDASGRPRGAKFTIHESTNGTAPATPMIAMGDTGEFVIAWQTRETNYWRSAAILVRRFDSAGQPIGDEIRVENQNGKISVDYPQLSLNDNGDFLVAWQVSRRENLLGPDPYEPAKSLFGARVYDRSGHLLTSDALITSDQFSAPNELGLNDAVPYVGAAAIATNKRGEAMVVWTQSDPDYTHYNPQDTLRAQTWILDHPPEVDLNGPAVGLDFAGSFQSGQSAAPVVIAAQLLVTDQIRGQLFSARISLENAQQGDILAVNTQGTSISASYSNGVLTLTGADTIASYQAVLRTTTFSSTANRQPGSKVRISFVVNDGTSNSPTALAWLSST